MTLKQLAVMTGKSPPFILNLTSRFSLAKTGDYSAGYAVLLRKLVALLLCGVAQKDIEKLLVREKNLLLLLNVDSLYTMTTWFEDLCQPDSGPNRLLLSGYDLGHPVYADKIQASLDFERRENELFSSQDMGEDALRGLRMYAETYAAVLVQMREEAPVIADSLKWIRQACKGACPAPGVAPSLG